MIYLPLPPFDRDGLAELVRNQGAPEEWEALIDPDAKPERMPTCLFNAPETQDLLNRMFPLVQGNVATPVVPSHTFLRRSGKGAIMKEHVDRPGLDWMVDVTITSDVGVPPLWIKEFGEWRYVPLEEDSAAMFRAGHIPHYRKTPYPGEELIQLFLHYREKSRCVVIPKFLSEWEIDRILSAAQEHADWVPGVVHRDGKPTEDKMRRNSITWLRRDQGWAWLYEKLACGARAAVAPWGLDATGESTDEIQMTMYQPGEFYDDHTDHNAGGRDPINRRSLSIVVYIQNPESGGGLHFRDSESGGLSLTWLKPGDAVVFDGDEHHKALPVKEGTRVSIALWLAAKEAYKGRNHAPTENNAHRAPAGIPGTSGLTAEEEAYKGRKAVAPRPSIESPVSYGAPVIARYGEE